MAGLQSFIVTPFGMYVNASRRGAFVAAVFAGLASAGCIASSIGRAIAAPRPLKNVLRCRCLPVMIMSSFGPVEPSEKVSCSQSPAPGWRTDNRFPQMRPAMLLTVRRSYRSSPRPSAYVNSLSVTHSANFGASFAIRDFKSSAPLKLRPSGKVPDESMSNLPSFVRHWPIALKFSKPKPTGSIFA